MRIISIETARRLFILRQRLNDSAAAHGAGILDRENQQDQGQSLILLCTEIFSCYARSIGRHIPQITESRLRP